MGQEQPEFDFIGSLPPAGQAPSAQYLQRLDQLRKRGDETADRLAEEVLTATQSDSTSRLDYNGLLNIVDKVVESPALVLNENSRVYRELGKYPEAIKAFFRPMPAPEWVDAEKLRVAGKIWQKDTLGILGVLYAASLPSCYLIKKGIPALYDTAKLREERYIFQRIYETGLMVDAVLGGEGIQVMTDLQEREELLQQALKNCYPGEEWTVQGSQLVRKSGAATQLNGDRLNEEFRKTAAGGKNVPRYLWGKGYITTKKVRFLHASMRFMLLHPGKVRASEDNIPRNSPVAAAQFKTATTEPNRQPYDVAELGVPINQEDLAFTLLTFGYCIPKGLENWGRHFSTGEKEAFLHLWRVVGHILGVQDNLVTDDWTTAERLFQTILEHQADASEQGKKLTDTLMKFLRDYLPDAFSWDRSIAALLIQSQLNRTQAEMVFSSDALRASRKFVPKFLVKAALVWLSIYFNTRSFIYRIPFLSVQIGAIFHSAVEALIESWRGAYRRKPFFVPKDATTWEQKYGVTERFRETLYAWRKKLFYTVFSGVACISGAILGLAAYLILLSLGLSPQSSYAGWGTALLSVAGVWLLRYQTVKVSLERPRINPHLPVEATDSTPPA